MKSFFALVVLLHLCAGLKPNRPLNNEIIMRLGIAEKLHKNNKLNLTSDAVRIPSEFMYNNPASCLGLFAKELNSLLHNVTVHEDSKHTIQNLKKNLEALKPYPENDAMCQMTELKNNLTPFKPYTKFVRKYNSKRR